MDVEICKNKSPCEQSIPQFYSLYLSDANSRLYDYHEYINKSKNVLFSYIGLT